MNNVRTQTWLITHVCGRCGIAFGMPKGYLAARRRDGQTFYCPNGHGRAFRETEVQRLRRRLEASERDLFYAQAARGAAEDQASAAERSLRATKSKPDYSDAPL